MLIQPTEEVTSFIRGVPEFVLSALPDIPNLILDAADRSPFNRDELSISYQLDRAREKAWVGIYTLDTLSLKSYRAWEWVKGASGTVKLDVSWIGMGTLTAIVMFGDGGYSEVLKFGAYTALLPGSKA